MHFRVFNRGIADYEITVLTSLFQTLLGSKKIPPGENHCLKLLIPHDLMLYSSDAFGGGGWNVFSELLEITRKVVALQIEFVL